MSPLPSGTRRKLSSNTINVNQWKFALQFQFEIDRRVQKNKYEKRTTMRPVLLYVTRCYLMLLNVTRCYLMLLLFHQEKNVTDQRTDGWTDRLTD